MALWLFGRKRLQSAIVPRRTATGGDGGEFKVIHVVRRSRHRRVPEFTAACLRGATAVVRERRLPEAVHGRCDAVYRAMGGPASGVACRALALRVRGPERRADLSP